MNTTVYLIRHSVRFKKKLIEKYNTSQNETLLSEKSILSPSGEKRAEILSDEKELQNLDVIYVSNCVRTLQTAKYIIEKQNLNVTIDERLDERRTGKSIPMTRKEWLENQYLNPEFKTEGGESQLDVRKRFTEAFNEILEENRGKRIAIFSHGYAITFFLLNWCSFSYLENTDDLKFTFKDKVVLQSKLNAPEVFKLEVDENDEPISIENIVFEDLPFEEGSGN